MPSTTFSSHIRFLPAVLCLILRIGFLPNNLMAQQHPIAEYLSTLPASIQVSMQVETEDGTPVFSRLPEKQVPSASIIKVPILFALIDQIDAGKLKWNDKHRLTASDKVGGAGELQFKKDGTTLSIRKLAREMIRVSDNTATNILIRKVSMEAVNAFIDEQVLIQIRLQREMMDFEAVANGRQNYTSALNMNQLYRQFLEGELVSEKGAKVALNMLTKCEDDSTIPSKLSSSLKIAHKTGTLDYIRGDSGIVFTDKGPLILSIFVEGFVSLEQAEEIIGELARLAVESWE